MAKNFPASQTATLTLARTISAEVLAWRNQGYHPFPSETTRQLLAHWFDRDEETGEHFHECQRLAIETIVYLHEIQQIGSLKGLYEKFAPENLRLFKTIADDVDGALFLKYCIKSATGSGKTWVLAALIIWQYFNAVNAETNAPYSAHFMIVTPGLEVRHRILDSFLGKRDPATGARDPATSDYRRGLFIPASAEWRGRFALLDNVLQPADIRANTTPPDAPFVAVTNWQQFAMPDDSPSLAEQLGLASSDDPQGEVVADFMTEHPDLIVLNDEAHHVHGKKTARADELVWRRFMGVLHRRMKEKHGNDAGLFLQFDFSATPFYGSGKHREYFSHIVYDYDLKDALRDMLVKQLFLEERTTRPGGPKLEDLDFHAERGEHRQAISLSLGQKRTIDIGVAKLAELTNDFRNKGLADKPVYMILCEDTTVADLVYDYLLTCKSPGGELFTQRALLLFHSELKKEKHGYTPDEARGSSVSQGAARTHPTLESIDDNNDPLRVVVSVLALREGFDKNNICVICALRAGEADILLEQIVGRGLRLMFPPYKTDPTVQEAKRQAVEALRRREKPDFALDFLYIVEHPRFRDFYDNLRKEGYLIAAGDSSTTPPTGDLIAVEAAPDRLARHDIAWPLAVREEAKLPDIAGIDVATLPPFSVPLETVRHTLASIAITDRHLETDTRAETWQLRDRNFNFDTFLAQTAKAISLQGRTRVLSAKLADIAALVDNYVSSRLFRQPVDFSDEFNYKVLADPQVQDFVRATIQQRIFNLLGEIKYEVKGAWRRLSDLARIHVRQHHCVSTRRCVYPAMPISARFGGLERDVMATTLDGSPEVLAWCKLQRRHGLSIAYREDSGLRRNYEVDFILRTADSCFLLETKSDQDMTHPNVGLKAKAAGHWCASINGLAPPADRDQPATWEYLLLPEAVYRANQGASFTALLPLMRRARDELVAQAKGVLYA